jgi:hypothetical protein
MNENDKVKIRHLLKKIQDAAIETINYHPNSRYAVEPILTYAKQLKDVLKLDA